MSNDENSEVVLDPEHPPDVELARVEGTPSLDIEKLAELGVVDLETSERDGKAVVTHCRIDARILAQMATEFHIVERRYGERWELGSWDPETRVPD